LAYSGNGTVDDPFIITNATELQNISANLSAYYKLGNDIDASETSSWNDGAGFIPIGNYTNKFSGELDGAGHYISGLYINRITNPVWDDLGWGKWYDGVGLFEFSNGSIKNLSLLNYSYTVWVNDTNTSLLHLAVGGIAGAGFDSSFCEGYDPSGFNITNCYVTGELFVTTDGSSPDDLYLRIGGLAGFGAFDHCAADVNLTVDVASQLSVSAGGMVGIGCGWTSYARGNVTIISPIAEMCCCGEGGMHSCLGGLIGAATAVDENYGSLECYSTGAVTFYSAYSNITDAGGLIGGDFGYSESSYFDRETSGLSCSVGGGTGKTTAQMKTVSTYLYNGWSTDGCMVEGELLYWWNEPWSFQFVPSVLYANPISSSAIALDWAVATSVWSLESGINDGYPTLVGLTPGATTKSNVAVFRKVGGYPDNTSDPNATLVYLGTDMSCYDTGLNAGTTYYYRAWGEIDGNYSAGYAEDVATTLVGKSGESKANVTTPEAPPWWFREPNCDLYKNLPGAKLGADLADSYDLPHPTACLLFTIFLLIIIGVGAYLITKNALGMMFILSIAIILFSIAGALFGWMLFIGIFLGGSIIYAWSRG